MTVKRFDCTNGGMHYCAGCYTMEEDTDGEYVRHEDYAKLEQQRAALVEALKPFSVPSIAGLPEDYAPDCTSYNFPPNAITVGDLRRVDAALRAAGVEL